MLRRMLTDGDHKLARVAASQHGIFTRCDALEVGLTSTQVNRRSTGYWIQLHEGVFRLPGAVPTWRSDLLAACLAAESKPAAVTRRAAAAYYGVPGGQEDLVEILCRRWKRTRTPGLIVHESTRFDEIDVTVREGIPIVTPERLVIEMAAIRPYPNFVEMVIQALRRKRLITYESTVQTFDRLARRGARGIKATRIALERWNPTSVPTHSEMETMLIQILREHGLPEPSTQFQVLDKFGNLVATTDAALSKWKITIEYQSKQEHLDEFQSLRDDRRRNAILAAGYFPLAARVEDLRSGGHVLVEQIHDLMRRNEVS
jgi:hypothetical protein